MLAKIKKSTSYPLIDRLIRLVLTLPVSTATSERAFSAMKLIKSKLRNMIEDGFLASYLIAYIEKDIARGFDVDSIIHAFDIMKERQVQLKMPNFNSGVLDTNMEALGRKMVKLCAGLPLAIVVLGGLLATKRHFPEDFRIGAERYHLWIADGIIVDDDRVGDETIMDVAKRYLGALAQRCMVQVQVETYTQRINYCRIHDLMLELCLSKAKIKDFLRIIFLQRETNLAICFSTTSTTTIPKMRRLAIHLNRDVQSVFLPDFETTNQLRSILFCNRGVYLTELNSHFKYFKLLRNLDLEGFCFDKKFVKSIGDLISLRYLSFRRCLIPKWHSSICKLKYLQTLDLRNCHFNSGEVIVLHRMEQLRHLYIQLDLDVKLKFDGLSNLETLGGFDTGSCDVNDLCKLINLRRVRRCNFLEEEQSGLGGFHQLPKHQCQPPSTNILIYLPEHCQGFSPSLIELKLSGCELEEDPMPTLERLPNLQYLYLGSSDIEDKLVNSADGFPQLKMVCSANGFLQLKTLELNRFYNLNEWEVEKGAMPNLSSLEIECCPGLEMVPEGLRFVATLQRFTIRAMSQNFKNKLRRINGEEGEDFYKVRHVSYLDIR
ncbi:disease resistance protein RPP8-like [Camellia sinensis]|uniref:disease resistance protein RPP8-like n=1 Tax=Camellia sinensis TaxID=4442 RepID=UPI00103568BC|nr:disease resistance protein RPP8-like [Camellia sinensis]